MIHFSCFFSPVGCVERTLGHAVLGGVFSQLTSWILGSVQWFLLATGHVLTSASEPSTIIRSASTEYDVLVTVAPGLLMIGLLVATLQALRHGDSASLWRVYLGVAPASVLAIVVAKPIAKLLLEAVNELSSSASSAVVLHVESLSGSLALLTPSIPGFGLFLLAVAVVIGTFFLWCELIVRAVVLTLLVVLVPLVAPLSTFPAGRRLGWRLAETFIAVAASKLLIVITLALGFDEILGTVGNAGDHRGGHLDVGDVLALPNLEVDPSRRGVVAASPRRVEVSFHPVRHHVVVVATGNGGASATTGDARRGAGAASRRPRTRDVGRHARTADAATRRRATTPAHRDADLARWSRRVSHRRNGTGRGMALR